MSLTPALAEKCMWELMPEPKNENQHLTIHLLLILEETPNMQNHSRYILMLSQSENLCLSLPARLSLCVAIFHTIFSSALNMKRDVGTFN